MKVYLLIMFVGSLSPRFTSHLRPNGSQTLPDSVST